MELKQKICVILCAVMFIIAAGIVETNPLISALLIAGMAGVAIVGKLDKRRTTVKEVLKEYGIK